MDIINLASTYIGHKLLTLSTFEVFQIVMCVCARKKIKKEEKTIQPINGSLNKFMYLNIFKSLEYLNQDSKCIRLLHE